MSKVTYRCPYCDAFFEADKDSKIVHCVVCETRFRAKDAIVIKESDLPEGYKEAMKADGELSPEGTTADKLQKASWLMGSATPENGKLMKDLEFCRKTLDSIGDVKREEAAEELAGEYIKAMTRHCMALNVPGDRRFKGDTLAEAADAMLQTLKVVPEVFAEVSNDTIEKLYETALATYQSLGATASKAQKEMNGGVPYYAEIQKWHGERVGKPLPNKMRTMNYSCLFSLALSAVAVVYGFRHSLLMTVLLAVVSIGIGVYGLMKVNQAREVTRGKEMAFGGIALSIVAVVLSLIIK